MKVIPITAARKNLYHLPKNAIKSSQPVMISTKVGTVVMLSGENWSAIQETIYLTQILGMKKSIQKAMKEPPEECAGSLDW